MLLLENLLTNLVITQNYNYPIKEGFICFNPIGGSPYKILVCKKLIK